MISFIEEGHLYINSCGILIPSVSELVGHVIDNSYTCIPLNILKQAQQFGTDIHNAIDLLIRTGEVTNFSDIRRELTFEGFLSVQDEVLGKNVLNEFTIDYKERYGGRIDLYSDGTLYDFKTNYKLDIPHLEWQLGFYKLALESKGYEVKESRCIWLRKGISKADIVNIKAKDKEECLKVLEDYEEQKNKGLRNTL